MQRIKIKRIKRKNHAILNHNLRLKAVSNFLSIFIPILEVKKKNSVLKGF
jgi:hypothetical protein